jgi:sulfatase maturation enzyme AslB (radical SAM superfamily)
LLVKEKEIKENFHQQGKFKELTITGKGEDRAFVEMTELKTLWFNTGTRCNLQCENCYIESSPTNDELLFITAEEVASYLEEIEELELGTEKISFTGGEPFLNKDMLPILKMCLEKGYEVLILTNAYRAIDRYFEQLESLNKEYPGKLILRVSLDHYTPEVHEKERGPRTFERTLKTMKILREMGIKVTIAGRSLADEARVNVLIGYQQLLSEYDIDIKVSEGNNIVIFPEMSTSKDVPEITTSCWDILNVHPDQQMCASERMVVKRKGTPRPVVLPCTLIAYDEQFELGHTLKESFGKVYLNHPYCAQFCVLGGASCSV